MCYVTYSFDLIITEVQTSHKSHGPEGITLDLSDFVVGEIQPTQHCVSGKGIPAEVLDAVVSHIAPRQLAQVLRGKET